jgi:hypothetical protein
MCIFCVGDDAPFYLRKSTAFPRKLIAEAVETDAAPCEKAKAAQFASGAELATVQSDLPQSRTSGPGDDDDKVLPLGGLGATSKQG